MNRLGRGVAAGAAALALVLIPAVAYSSVSEVESSTAVDSLEKVAPEVLQSAVELESEGSTGDAAHAATANGVDVKLPATGADPIVFSSGDASVEIALPQSAHSAAAQKSGGTTVQYASGDGSTTIPVVKADGTLQITTVINSAASPGSYAYDLVLPEGFELLAGEGGGVGIAAVDRMSLLGVFAAPWAKDAVGQPVPTRYEIQGTTLVQVVDHASGDYEYPVVADPWLGVDLYGSPSLDTYGGAFRVNVTPTQQGKDWAGIATWWAHSDEVRNKLAARYPDRPASQRWNDNVQEQLYCHIAGLPFSLPEYNLEAFRVFKYWEDAALYKCNYPESTWSN